MITFLSTDTFATTKRVFVGLALAAFASACSKSSSPTAPSPAPPAPAAPTVTAITVAGLDAVRTGFFSDYTATATMSDGTTQAVTASATWTISNANAAIDGARLTGRSHGPTALTATYQSRTATKSVNIVNNYGGTWNGSYTPTACDAAGAFASAQWCKDVRGVPASLSLVLTQAGNDRSQVSGTLSNAFIRNAPVTGTVTVDGRLVLGADATGTSSGVTFRFQLGGWDTQLTAASQMTGRTAVSLSAQGLSGNAYEEHNITGATLSNPQLASLAER